MDLDDLLEDVVDNKKTAPKVTKKPAAAKKKPVIDDDGWGAGTFL